MPDYTNILPEQASLIGGGPGDPFWSGRLEDQDEVARLGELFIVNGLATPTRLANTGLVPRTARDGVGMWLAGVQLSEDDDIAILPDVPEADAPVLRIDQLAEICGVALEEMPPAYHGWRFTTEVYVLVGRSVYAVNSSLAMRVRVLADHELGVAYSGRMLPLLGPERKLSGVMVFVVAVPARAAAVGGLRGQRLALLAAGEAGGALATLTRDGEWMWETEFFDDAAARVLGVDGVERIPLVIGVELDPDEKD